MALAFIPHRAGLRLGLGTALGFIVALALPHSWSWEARALLGWAVFCAVNLLRLSQFLNLSGEQTRKLATREDETRVVAAVLTLLASLVSLVGVLFAMHEATHTKGTAAYLLTALVVLTVALSWLLIHAEYALHYARLYYIDKAGVQFAQPDSRDPLPDPRFLEFAYLSFTIGMTFQVSDQTLDTHKMRKLLLGHSLLSYAFNAVVVAVTINALASVVG